MNVNVMKKPNLPVWRTNPGVALNVYPRNGYVMVIQIVWMALMKMLPYTTVLHSNLVLKICSPAAMEDALIR